MNDDTGHFFQSFFGSQAPTPSDIAKRSQIEKADTRETDNSDTPTSAGNKMEVHMVGRGTTPYSELTDDNNTIGTNGTKSTNRSKLDFENNDNTFHVLGSLLVEIYSKELSADKSFLTINESMRGQVNNVLPSSARSGFISAVRRRSVRPSEDLSTSIDAVVKECKKLGFHLDSPRNPILMTFSSKKLPIRLDISPQVEERDTPSVSSTAKSQHRSSTYDLARDQLISEIRQATRLRDESVTPETIKFWKEHINGLQLRLRSLEGVSPALRDNESLAPKSVMENRFRSKVSYKPPTLEPSQSEVNVVVPVDSKTVVADLPTVDVVSPADLPAGYHFEAEIRGKRFVATVPEGGVKKGQTFTSIMRDLKSFQIDIPVGYWKDSSIDCFRHGIFHPVIWNSIFCPLLVLSQISERLNLDFLGRPRAGQGDHFSNRSMATSVTVFWGIMNFVVFALYNLKWSQGLELSFADIGALAIVNAAMSGFIVFVAQSTRGTIRERFLIREERCDDLEDVCLSAFFLPCTVSQMARHTANYDEYDAACCTDTGLSAGAPPVSLEPKLKEDSHIV